MYKVGIEVYWGPITSWIDEISPPIYVLCVSSHFWPFTKVNFVLTILQKSWDSVRPPPPGWDKIPSLSKEIFLGLPLCVMRKLLWWLSGYLGTDLLRTNTLMKHSSPQKQSSFSHLTHLTHSSPLCRPSWIMLFIMRKQLWWLSGYLGTEHHCIDEAFITRVSQKTFFLNFVFLSEPLTLFGERRPQKNSAL